MNTCLVISTYIMTVLLEPKEKNLTFWKTKISVVVEKIKAKQLILFNGPNRDKHKAWECVTATVNNVGQKNTSVADIKKEMDWQLIPDTFDG